jgi:uncharacterized membrane protein
MDTGNGDHPVQRNTATAIALTAVFAAVAVGGNYALAGVPNVEVSSVMVFLSGFLFGLTTGALTGLVSMTIFEIWNPWGPFIPPIGVAVIGCTILIGVVGGITGKNVQYTETYDSKWFLGPGIIGVFLTVFYDLVTSFASSVTWGAPFSVILVFGLPFTLIHVISNGILFGALTPPIAKVVGHLHQRTNNLDEMAKTKSGSQ